MTRSVLYKTLHYILWVIHTKMLFVNTSEILLISVQNSESKTLFFNA